MAYCLRKFNKIRKRKTECLAYDYFSLKECIESAKDCLELDENIEFINIYEILLPGTEKYIRTLKNE